MPPTGTQEDGEQVQYGALPYRWSDTGALEVLLITSRRTRRWIVPKGWPMKDRKPWETAAIEAREEAGVSGVIAKRAVGRFRYDKLVEEDERLVPCEVTLFPLFVTRYHRKWQERHQREAIWVSPPQAAALAADPGLRIIIASLRTFLGAAMTSS